MMIQITCPECGSSIESSPDQSSLISKCKVCKHEVKTIFNEDHLQGDLKNCPVCLRQDFYQQKDFNRKIGVLLFIIAAIASIWTYGLSLVVLYLMDLFLFKKLGSIAICYKCQTIFRKVRNLDQIPPYDHEMNDRIVYSDHDFKGKPL